MTHIPNEEPDRTRRKIGAAMGVVAGYPDLMLFIPAIYIAEDGEVFRDVHGLAIELKNGKRGRHGIHQRICQMRMEACGYRYVLVRTLEEFDTEVTDYLKHMPKGLPDRIGKIAAEADKMRLEDWKKQEAKSVAKARKEFQELIDAKKRNSAANDATPRTARNGKQQATTTEARCPASVEGFDSPLSTTYNTILPIS